MRTVGTPLDWLDTVADRFTERGVETAGDTAPDRPWRAFGWSALGCIVAAVALVAVLAVAG